MPLEESCLLSRIVQVRPSTSRGNFLASEASTAGLTTLAGRFASVLAKQWALPMTSPVAIPLPMAAFFGADVASDALEELIDRIMEEAESLITRRLPGLLGR